MKRCRFSILVFVSSCVFAQQNDTTTVTQIGQSVPPFSITTLDGHTIHIQDLKHQTILINFFATWSSACDMEMPELENQIWQKYKKTGLWVIAIGREHTKEELVAYKKEKGVTFAIAPDPKRDVFKLFAKQYIPRNILINPSGKIAYQSVGYSAEEFQKLIAAIEHNLQK